MTDFDGGQSHWAPVLTHKQYHWTQKPAAETDNQRRRKLLKYKIRYDETFKPSQAARDTLGFSYAGKLDEIRPTVYHTTQSSRYGYLSRYNSSRLLTPPKEEEEVYPYRPVWRSIILELSFLFVATSLLVISDSILGLSIPPRLQPIANIAFVFMPTLLWYFFSYLRERIVPEPRLQLMTVFLFSALIASAVGLPAVNFLKEGMWLSHLETIDRLIGLTVTVGVAYELIKYLVIRYTTVPGNFRIRLDVISYSAASAVGFVTVINLQLLSVSSIELSTLALQVFGNTVMQVGGGMIVAFGIAETHFSPRTLFVMPISLLIGAAIHGLGTTAIASLSNAGFALGFAAPRPLFGLIAASILIYGVLFTMIFLFSSRERQEREAVASREV